MGALARLWRHNRLLLVAFVLACALTLFFGGRMVMHAIYWADPAHQDQPLAGWMTPRYVAHSWHVPPEVVMEALELERKDRNGEPPTLSSIAAARGESLPEVAQRVVDAITEFRAARQ